MADGSRHFGDLPETYDSQEPEWHRIKAHVSGLAGAVLTGFVTDDVTEAWIDFTLREQEISLNNQQGQWWFFVRDPACPDELLLEVLDHFEALLNPRGAVVRRLGPLTAAFRVMVYEEDGRVSFKDFDERGTAEAYANDAALESGLVVAQVFDQHFRRVHTGGTGR